jgi:metallo-beta-lactamase class B
MRYFVAQSTLMNSSTHQRPRGHSRALTAPSWRTALAVLGILVLGFLFVQWRAASNRGGQKYAQPFRIAGNLYYVGANDVSAFLITGNAGDILIDGGYPGMAPMIIASIKQLGFDIRDVRILLNSEPHFDHAGGLAALQKASGAQLWASDASAYTIESGGDDPVLPLPIRALFRTRIISYPPAHVNHRVHDGDTVRLGDIALTAHITAGHTRGCTSWSFPVADHGRVLNVVSASSLVKLGIGNYTTQTADFEHTFRVLQSLPADIWMTSHARLWGRYRKFAARDTAHDPVQPFIDPDGYRAYIDSGEARVKR